METTPHLHEEPVPVPLSLAVAGIAAVPNSASGTYFIQFAIGKDEPSFLSTVLEMQPEEAFDSFLRRAKEAVLSRLLDIMGEILPPNPLMNTLTFSN